MDAVVNCAAYCQGQRVANLEIDTVSDVLKETDKFVWIGLQEPDREMLARVQREFGLHDLAIEDALRAHQRPKIEAYGDSLFIVLRTAELKGERIDLGETHFFLGKNFLITVRHGSSLSYSEVRHRCESTPHLLKKGPGFALYAVMDFIVDQFFPVIDALEHKLSVLEENILDEKFRRATTAQIFQFKRELLEVKRSVSPLTEICNKLMRFDLTLIEEETRPYFRDVYDHSIRMNDMVDNAREMLSTAMDINFSLLSISQNEVSKRFAGWAAIIGIPTMVAGVYGMNFKHMPELDYQFGYPLVMAATAGFCVLLYFFFKRSGWV